MTKRDTLANIAEVEALKNFHGFNENNISNLHPITSLFPKWSLEDADFSWCAAFVYYCCKLADYKINTTIHNTNKSFAGCKAWEEWAKLPENYFFHDRDACVLKGDIVIYDFISSDEYQDHMGIVLKANRDYITVAEGNIDNISGVIKRERNNHIRGYIRIPDDYLPPTV